MRLYSLQDQEQIQTEKVNNRQIRLHQSSSRRKNRKELAIKLGVLKAKTTFPARDMFGYGIPNQHS